jgi:4-amino-4-deoxy-L-arabinose transferase-like glycosyltransferase
MPWVPRRPSPPPVGGGTGGTRAPLRRPPVECLTDTTATARPLPSGRDARVIALLCALAVVALGVRLTFFTGLFGDDDTAYASAATALRDGRLAVGADLVSLRVGLLALAAGSYALLGVSEVASVMPALLASIATLFVVYGIALLLHGPSAAAIAGLLYALSPLNVLFSTTLLPELPMALAVSLAVLLVLLAERCVTSTARAALAFLGGITAGAGYLMKEPAALIVVVLALVGAPRLLRGDRTGWLYLLPLVGFGVVLLGEAICYHSHYGDLLHRFGGIARAQATATASSERERELQSWRVYPRAMFVVVNQVGLLFWWLAGFGVIAMTRRLPTPPLLLCWFALLLGYLQFGSTSLTSYHPLPKQPRYLEAVTAPTVLLLGIWIAEWARRSSSRVRLRKLAIALVPYAVTSLGFIALSHIDLRTVFRPVRETAPVLASLALRAVSATPLLADGLPLISSQAGPVGRPCRHCKAGPCGRAPELGAGEVWAVPITTSGPVPAVDDCQQWRVLLHIPVHLSRPERWVISGLADIAARVPLPDSLTRRSALQQLLETRYVTVNVWREAKP